MSIKKSVSLYSLQDEYCRHRMSLNDIFDELEKMGVGGVELISDQMIRETPNPSEAELAKWDEIVKTHNLKLVCNDVFLNTTVYNNRVLTDKESAALLTAELRLAKRLGFKLIRLVSMTPFKIAKMVLPLAEELGITMALEIHAGLSFDKPATKEFCEQMIALNNPYLGLVIDTGIFCRRNPLAFDTFFLALGVNPELPKYFEKVYAQGLDHHRLVMNGVPEDLQALIKTDVDRSYFRFTDGYENCDYSILDPYIPYIKHVHGKCFDFMEDGSEYSMNFQEIVNYLDSKGYDGYLSTEYEGNRFVIPGGVADGLSHVKAHQALLTQCIANLGRN